MDRSTSFPSYSAYKPSTVDWLGDVPPHWEIRRLKSICRFAYGDSLPAEARASGHVPVYGSNGIVGFHSSSNTDGRSLLIGRKGSFGKIHYSSGSAFAIDTTFYVDNRSTDADIRWLYYLLSSLHLDAVSRDSAVPGLSRDDAYSHVGPLPPLPEQHAIARYLDHVDRRIQRYIDTKEKLIALQQEARNVATIEAMQSSSTTNQRLSAVANIVERPIKRASAETYTPIGLYNRGRGIFRKEPRNGAELGDSDFFWIEEGDLVISGQFAWEGAIALAGNVEHGCVASHRFPILRGKPGIADTGFLLAFFQTDWGHHILDHNSRGAAGRNRPLNVRTLLKEKISLPPIGTQMRIAEMLQSESRVRQQTRRMEQLLKEYRASLIAHVVTGKLDVRAAAANLLPEINEQKPVEG